MRCLFIAFAIISLSLQPGFAAPVNLSRDGFPLLPIVISPNASEEIHSLATELAQGLEKITGGKFAITSRNEKRGIFVGTSEEFPGYLPEPKKGLLPSLTREDYMLKSETDRLLLIGRTPLAVQNAVWDLLYRIGFRQYLPGKKWEIWPKIPNLAVDVHAVESPDYFSRRLRVGGTTWPQNRAAVEEWKRRNRMVSGFTLSSGHVYGRIVSQYRDFFENNPGAYAGTEREAKLDASREDVLGVVGEYARQEIETNPERDSISMEPSDGGGWPENSPLGSPSNQAVVLANHAAKALRDAGLERKVGLYAYNLHSPPPDIDVDPDVIVSVATSFIKGGHTAESLMGKWHAKGAEIGVREYLGVAPWDFGLPGRARASDPDYIADTISRFYELGARYWDSEVTEAWGVHGLGFFLTARLLWDTKESKDALMKDFFTRSFGNSADIMKRLFQTGLLKTGNPMLSEDLIGRMYRLLDEALKQNNPPDVVARIQDFVLYVRYAELMFQYQNSTGDAKKKVFDEIAKLVQGNFDSFMFDRWTIFREIPGRAFRVKKGNIVQWMQAAVATAKPLNEQDLREIVANGIKNNPLLDFESVTFSKELVPYQSMSEQEASPSRVLLRGMNRIYLFGDKEKSEFEFIVQGGMVYKDRGDVEIRLFSDEHPILDEPVDSVTLKPDKSSQRVKLSSPYGGAHRLEISDGSGGTRVSWPAGQKAAFPASSEENTMFYEMQDKAFFVPAGTKVIGGYSSNRTGKIVTGNGRVAFDFSDTPGAGYFSVKVPKGEDNACWLIQGMQGRIMLLTVPPYVSLSADGLLIPRESQSGEDSK